MDLAGQGVAGAQDKVRAHCTTPGAYDKTAAAAGQAYLAEFDHGSLMSQAARQTRLQTRAPQQLAHGTEGSAYLAQELHTPLTFPVTWVEYRDNDCSALSS